MSGAAFAALGAVSGAFVTAIGSLVVLLAQRRSILHNDHLLRAFEKHLGDYEQVFVSVRAVQNAFHDFNTVSARVTDRSDPFLFQLLEVAAVAAHQFCVAVDTRHNPGMAYMELGLENRCLLARDLLMEWLSNQRIRTGDVASIRTSRGFAPIPPPRIPTLDVGDYHELRIETRRLLVDAPGDKSRQREIDRAMTAVIKELKKVMAF